jgi:uncharacterized protein YndB with AHSA1/START domain
MSKPKTGAARAIADVTEGVILASVEIEAPPERVYRALTDSSEIVRWWGSDELYWTKRWTSDLRVGGKWRADGLGSDGHAFAVEGEFLEIDPPRKLVHTWKPDWDGGAVTTVSYSLEPIAQGTRVTVRHDGFGDRAESCRNHGTGWERVLAWLAMFSAPQPEPLPVFLCRLVAPRPSFAPPPHGDMNAEERALMGEHMAYWMQHLNAGNVIVFGPVGDPEGPWGLGIVRAKDLAALQAFQEGDPVIRSGRGFRFVTLPMIKAVY